MSAAVETMTRATEARIIRAVATAKYPKMALGTIAANYDITLDDIRVIINRAGYPDLDRMHRAAAQLAEGGPNTAQADEAPTQPAPAQMEPAAAAEPAPAPAPAPAESDEIRALLDTCKAHESKRIQRAADKAIDDIAKLRRLLVEDEEKHAERRKAAAAKEAARAEVERLEQQLAEAKAKLRGTSTPAAASKRANTAPKGEHRCGNDGCDRVFDTGQGRSMHERMRCEHRPQAVTS